jgi:cell division protein FtsB
MSTSQATPSQSYPTQPKSLGRGKYLAAIVVLSILLIGASGTAAYYYNHQGKPPDYSGYLDQIKGLNSQIDSLNAQIASLNAQIALDKSSIDSLNVRISQLLQAQCVPDSGYSSCSVEIANLQSQVSQLQSDKATLQAKVDNLTAQVNNLTDIVNMKKKTIVADSKTINWSACGETGQPSCTNQSPYLFPSTFLSFCPSTCYSGYLNLTWTSTQHLTVTFTFSLPGSAMTSTTSTGSASSGAFIIPYAVGLQGGSAGFHNDSCFTDAFGNIHCPSGTMTYSESYVY